jgi:hypothetical protein
MMIRVVFLGKAPEGRLDLLERRILLDPQDMVVILH